MIVSGWAFGLRCPHTVRNLARVAKNISNKRDIECKATRTQILTKILPQTCVSCWAFGHACSNAQHYSLVCGVCKAVVNGIEQWWILFTAPATLKHRSAGETGLLNTQQFCPIGQNIWKMDATSTIMATHCLPIHGYKLLVNLLGLFQRILIKTIF